MRLAQSHKVLGILFLVLLVGSVYLTYAVFTKKFADYEKVTLQTSKIGLQLPMRADVKIRGVIVGEVIEIDTDADGAVLTLGIFPSEVDTIPANVTGSIVPKTLFGEKYVSLVVPEGDPAGDHIEAGDDITRTEVSIEVEKVLSDLYPLLRTVQPAEINLTLNAMATALEGRGEVIGENLETVDSYLKRINPQIPDIVEDLRLTARVSDVYADVMPQIAAILRNTVTTTQTLEGREAKLEALFTDVAAFSGTARGFLRENGDNLIRLSEIGEAQPVFAKYAPEFPCLTGGIVNAGKLQAEAFRGFTLHIILEPLKNQPRGYGPQDKPRFGEKRGPSCLNLPSPPWSQKNPVRHQPNMDDGVDESTGKGTSRVAPQYFTDGRGLVGSPQESALLKSLLGPVLGLTADDVPDLGALLLGPMARGAEVTYR